MKGLKKIRQIPKKLWGKLSKSPIFKQYEKRKSESQFVMNLKRNTPVFVYQMGKVASSSIYSSIKKQYAGLVFHDHNFGENSLSKEVFQLYSHYQNKNFPIKIISLVREPIGRNLSAFFENFKRDTGVAYKDSNYAAEELQHIFLQNYKHDIPLIWFDNNFKTEFNIDVFAYDFPGSNYLEIKKDNVSLLLMKHDVPDHIKEEIIRTFIDVPSFKLKNANISEQKEYAQSYNEVKKLKLPKEYVDRMLASKYTQHFYRNDIQKLKEKFSLP